MRRSISRRALLRVVTVLPITGLTLLVRNGVAEGTTGMCVDAEDMNESLRKSLHYTEISGNPNSTCSVCAFFGAADKQGCGQCQILNAPASAGAHCDSWSKR
jgi:hypothetical protein